MPTSPLDPLARGDVVLAGMRVTVPPRDPCDADDCARQARAHMVWLHEQRAVVVANICPWHAFRFKARGGCMIFPWGQCPDPKFIAAAVEQKLRAEQQRRMAYQYQQPMWFGSTTSTGGWRVSFG